MANYNNFYNRPCYDLYRNQPVDIREIIQMIQRVESQQQQGRMAAMEERYKFINMKHAKSYLNFSADNNMLASRSQSWDCLNLCGKECSVNEEEASEDYQIFQKQLQQLKAKTAIEGDQHEYIALLQELQDFSLNLNKSTD